MLRVLCVVYVVCCVHCVWCVFFCVCMLGACCDCVVWECYV